jgi:hypothetical protein
MYLYLLILKFKKILNSGILYFDIKITSSSNRNINGKNNLIILSSNFVISIKIKIFLYYNIYPYL